MSNASNRSGSDGPWTPPALCGRGAVDWAVANLAATALYFLMAALVSRFFAAYGLFPAPIWLPAGIATVVAMIGGFRVLPGIFLGSFLANDLLFAPPLYITAIISTANALGPVLGAVLLRRLRPAPRPLHLLHRGHRLSRLHDLPEPGDQRDRRRDCDDARQILRPEPVLFDLGGLVADRRRWHALSRAGPRSLARA
jgi:MASE1